MTLLRLCRRISVERFNRICLIVALAWLEVAIPFSIVWRPTHPDFPQFYMGGVIARRSDWSALYPIPLRGSQDNPGLSWHSKAKNRWQALRKRYDVPDYTRFILPPPTALLFIPLSYLNYTRAFWLFTFMLIGSVWGVILVAGRLYRILAGRPSRCEGALAVLIALSPMTARSIRIANVSPPVALVIGLALFALLRREPLRGAFALLLGALLKYATLVLTPLLLAMRRWRMFFGMAAVGLFILLLTVAIAGTAPFLEFYHVILPTLSRPSSYRGNQSLPGMLARLYGRPFPTQVLFALDVMRVSTLLLVFGLLARVRPREWSNPSNVFAATGALVSWLLIFSPIAWEHWPIFLCPIWGWLLWEARAPGLKRFLAISSLALMYFPAGILQVDGIARFPILLPEPFNSSQLFGMVLLLILGAWRLALREPEVIVEKSPVPALS